MDQITIFGIDLNESYSQISYYKEAMEEPASISPHVGSQSYLIPTVVAKRPGVGQWFIGDEALAYHERVEEFLSKAYKRDSIMVDGILVEAIDLLTLFLRRVLALSHGVGCDKKKDYFILCIDHASALAIESLFLVMERLDIPKEHVKICERKEAFCYYVMNQEPSLRMRDVLLLDYWKHAFRVFELSIKRNVTPNVVSVSEVRIAAMEQDAENLNLTKEEKLQYKDEQLSGCLDDIIGGKMISSIYLVGQGFEGDWMKKSLSRLCAGRRVFYGMNLYTKGACYYGKRVTFDKDNVKDYLYLGGGNLLYNICVKVFHRDEFIYHVLIGAGDNWQDAKGQMEVILEGTDEPEIEVVCKSIKDEEDILVKCKLDGLKVSKDRTTRVRIETSAISRDRIRILIKDIGFGEICPGSNKEWQFSVKL